MSDSHRTKSEARGLDLNLALTLFRMQPTLVERLARQREGVGQRWQRRMRVRVAPGASWFQLMDGVGAYIEFARVSGQIWRPEWHGVCGF
ncbi:hypothetical protein PspLS_03971 [Pyricularia sp. CBS 133598]|nr:hypothetical protein PspLS_03971 [Pyricularia sp. CBS 133598]